MPEPEALVVLNARYEAAYQDVEKGRPGLFQRRKPKMRFPASSRFQ